VRQLATDEPAPVGPAGPQVGADEWVARQPLRRDYLPSWLGNAQRRVEKVGWWPRLGLAAAAGLILPLLHIGQFQLQVGIDSLVLALLALGLNVTVGWAGLLDLGYVAFFGFGAYGFALVSSDQLSAHGVHWPAYFSIPVVVVATGLVGLLVGLPSRRLSGDYLAIITLFFGEAFYEITNNVATSKLGGEDGIVGIDPIRGFGIQLLSTEQYYYLMIAFVVGTMIVLRLLEFSRTGRSWRAIRDDPLAASAMTISVDKVKLMAFAFGAMVAGLAGTEFAAQQVSIAPTDFTTQYLILIYACLILGGAGSIGGAVAGAVVLNVVLDGILRNPTYTGYLFYGLIVIALLVKLRPWRRLAIVLGSTIVFGYAVHAIAAAISHSWVSGSLQSGGWIASALRGWVIVPASATGPGDWGFVLLICMLITLAQVKGRWRTVLLVPTIYLASFTWETLLGTATNASITRYIIIAVVLIVMMIARPQGLLGTRRVEVPV
jgi:branched-chain amino acid transport system permease protein